MILLGIRGETIKYSSRKKKLKQKEEKILENEISKLENSISADLQNANIEDDDDDELEFNDASTLLGH